MPREMKKKNDPLRKKFLRFAGHRNRYKGTGPKRASVGAALVGLPRAMETLDLLRNWFLKQFQLNRRLALVRIIPDQILPLFSDSDSLEELIAGLDEKA